MSIEFIFRMVGMVVLALVGLTSGIQLARLAEADAILYATVFTLLGALVGLVVTPWITIRPVRALRNRIRQMPAQQLVAATLGLTAGLVVALLVSFPLSLLPEPYRGRCDVPAWAHDSRAARAAPREPAGTTC